MRVAVVGAGISGLVVAHLLYRPHEVAVFEANAYAGGRTNTIRVDTPNETHQVDTGFIVFNDRNYPNFERLLDRLGVGWQRSTMSFSVSDGMGDFEYSSASANGLFAKRAHLLAPWFHRMIADLARFNRAARELLGDHADDVSLGDWLERHRFSRPFIERLIVPQASAVWSADPGQMWSLPARFLAEFFDNHGMLSLGGRPCWRTVRGGSARYVEALTGPFGDRLRLHTPVDVVTRHPDHVLVKPRGGEAERFDEVVLATHSDQALALLGDASDREREILGAIPYQANEAVLHTDVRMLPRRPVSFYYCFDPGGERVQALAAEVTNTPWGERHAYVLGGEQGSAGVLDGQFDKALHVSPFMGMDHRYHARAGMPGKTLSVHIASSRAGATVFDATLALRRRELTRASIAGITARYPLATVRVLALIYTQALGLALAGVPVHRHPQAGAR